MDSTYRDSGQTRKRETWVVKWCVKKKSRKKEKKENVKIEDGREEDGGEGVETMEIGGEIGWARLVSQVIE